MRECSLPAPTTRPEHHVRVDKKLTNDASCKSFIVRVVGSKRSRANKNRPMEQSSRRAVGRLMEVVAPVKKATRDPRFESLSGNFDDTVFRKTHAFLFNENLPNERKKLQAKLKVRLDLC